MKTNTRLLLYIEKQSCCQGGAFLRVFLLRFRFQIYCSCFNYIMTSIILLSINSGKRFIKVLNTCRFAFVRIKKMYQLGVGNCLFLRARVWGKDRGVPKGHDYK